MKRNELKEMAMRMYYFSTEKEHRLNHCQCWYKQYEGNIIVKSYSTIVGFYNYNTDTYYVFNYYSATTSQHNSKMINKIDPEKVVYLYDRSDHIIIWNRVLRVVHRATKEMRENNEKNSYEGYIEIK